MSPSEIAFLALGLILGAAIGAAFVEAVRARPAPRREVRLTVSPNSIVPRRAVTLASSDADVGRAPIAGSPADDGWLERRLAGEPVGDVGESVGPGLPPTPGGSPSPNRTRVPSGPVSVPSTAVAVPVAQSPAAVGHPLASRIARPGPGPGSASATATQPAGRTAVLDRISPRTFKEQDMTTQPPADRPSAHAAQRPEQQPAPPAPAAVQATGAAPLQPAQIAAQAGGDAPGGAAGDGDGGMPAGGSGASSDPAGTRACEAERHLVEERCALADAAREQARLAADALRDAQRAYDVLRERVERAQALADPREIRASKDTIHREFRSARASAATAAAAEGAARDWLNEINRLNTAAREAARILESGTAEMRAQVPRLERLAVEADAARITAEGAELGCREARVALARCEEQAALDASAVAAAAKRTAEEPTARDRAWPTDEQPSLRSAAEAGELGVTELAAIVRILRGDRPTRERLIAALTGADPEAAREWPIRIAGLVDAINARAIEDGYLDLPDDGFWGLFTHRERREIVAALSALGFRFDGLAGFADGRVPAQRDLSLAVGYAGLDRMRIRTWPRDAELAGMYAGAVVAADEWLAGEAGDLSLGRMVDALGARAAELADLWNAWGRVRPALLATD